MPLPMNMGMGIGMANSKQGEGTWTSTCRGPFLRAWIDVAPKSETLGYLNREWNT
jgi:hypothetical protein